MSPCHDDVIKWKLFRLYWPIVRGIHRSQSNSLSHHVILTHQEYHMMLHLHFFFLAILKTGSWLLLNVIIQSRKKSIVIWRFCLSLRVMIVHQVVDYWHFVTWWRHQMGIFSALLALCAGNSPPTQWCIIWSELNKRLSKQSWGWWCETPSRSFWRHFNDTTTFEDYEMLPWKPESSLYLSPIFHQ